MCVVLVMMAGPRLQFEEKLQLSGHEDWIRDVHFAQEGAGVGLSMLGAMPSSCAIFPA